MNPSTDWEEDQEVGSGAVGAAVAAGDADQEAEPAVASILAAGKHFSSLWGQHSC